MLYYVKGQQTNRHSLWAEWISAHVGVALGLPLPPFRLLQVDIELFDEVPSRLRGIGTLPCFGSQQSHNVAWFEPALTCRVSPELQRAVLAFDWWIKNMDRTAGNPNLLWDAGQESMVVIDHNQAFDPSFDADTFLRHHIFAGQWQSIIGDFVTRDALTQRMVDALSAAKLACDGAPTEWMWENTGSDVPANFSPSAALELLQRCETEELWRTE